MTSSKYPQQTDLLNDFRAAEIRRFRPNYRVVIVKMAVKEWKGSWDRYQ